MKVSKFLNILKKDQIVAFYNSLTMDCVYLDREIYNNYVEDFNKKMKSNCDLASTDYYRFLYKNNFLTELDEDKLLDEISNMLTGKVEIKNMVLHMTDYCNLNCKYCFIEDGIDNNTYIRRNMSYFTCEKAVDKFFEIMDTVSSTKKPSIIFYGGEPLVNWKVIRKILPYIKNKEITYNIDIDKVIITNATLIDKEIAKVLEKYNVETCISLDGNKYINDINRRYRDDRGSFDDVINAIKILRENGVEPALSSVMTKESVDKIEETAKFLFDDLKIKGLGFNHVSILPKNKNYSSYDSTYENKYAEGLIKMQEIIQKNYTNVYEKRMGIKINSFLDKEFNVSSCTGTGLQISVSTDGFIGVCQGYMGCRKTFNNTVFDENYDPRNDEIFIEWSKRSPLNIKKCRSCIALSNCGGGCPRNANVLTGSIWGLDKGFCRFSKLACEWMIWENFKDESIKKDKYLSKNI